MPNTKCQKQYGITLIALIITVIVLLILAGTAITIGLNGGQLFSRANNAAIQWNSRVSEEENAIVDVLKYLEEKKAKFVDNLASKTHVTDYQNITSVERASKGQAEGYMIESNKASTDDSDYPIYMWSNNNTLYWYSEAEHPKLGPNSTGLFAMFHSLQNTSGIHDWDTRDVTDMGSMFAECFSLTNIDLSSWNTGNVTNFGSMFHTCGNLTSINLSSFDTRNATRMFRMFAACYALSSLDLSSWDTNGITDMSGMFDMSENMNFSGSRIPNLRTIIVSSGFVVNNVDSSSDMFKSCTTLIGGAGTTFDSTKTDKSMAHVDVAGNPGYFTLK